MTAVELSLRVLHISCFNTGLGSAENPFVLLNVSDVGRGFAGEERGKDASVAIDEVVGAGAGAGAVGGKGNGFSTVAAAAVAAAGGLLRLLSP